MHINRPARSEIGLKIKFERLAERNRSVSCKEEFALLSGEIDLHPRARLLAITICGQRLGVNVVLHYRQNGPW